MPPVYFLQGEIEIDMAQLLDFNIHRPNVLPLKLADDKQTMINVVPPTVDLQEELRANSDQLSILLGQADEEMIEALYDLAARLMSCNRNYKKFTAEDLRTTYRMDAEDLAVFYLRYSAYLEEMEHAKN